MINDKACFRRIGCMMKWETVASITQPKLEKNHLIFLFFTFLLINSTAWSKSRVWSGLRVRGEKYPLARRFEPAIMNRACALTDLEPSQSHLQGTERSSDDGDFIRNATFSEEKCNFHFSLSVHEKKSVLIFCIHETVNTRLPLEFNLGIEPSL